MLSIILPAYNEEKMISIAAQKISEVMKQAQIAFQIVFVDDGSKDQTWNEICDACSENMDILGVRFSRNFGKEAAMFAGLEHASGDCCVVIDCDLQHPPEKIVEMYHLWEQGYEVVEGIKESRGEESIIHKFSAQMFYKVISRATKIDLNASSDFKLLDRKVVDTLNKMPERAVFFRALSYWVGFKKTTVSYVVQKRTEGETKWSTKSLIRYAITNITSFSAAPMQIVTWVGLAFFIFSCVLSIQTLVKKAIGDALGGFTTVILIQSLSSSVIMLSLGIIGFYIARIYDEIKRRPRFIVSEVCNK